MKILRNFHLFCLNNFRISFELHTKLRLLLRCMETIACTKILLYVNERSHCIKTLTKEEGGNLLPVMITYSLIKSLPLCQ